MGFHKVLFLVHNFSFVSFSSSSICITLHPSRPSNPCFSSPVHLQRCSIPDGVRDLYCRKEELWARNGRLNLARQSDFHVIAGFFYMPQSCDMGQTDMLRIFSPEKSDGFGRVSTRDLGYQRPEW
jgi:hypothetical protein